MCTIVSVSGNPSVKDKEKVVEVNPEMKEGEKDVEKGK